ncbi:hypothetical protein [Micromonospora sp. NBC_01796]|uniref:hypothetical protein n=1 Tax=Micromonospora sp. NBC_01796 TaxID=2975987 RepID=UPI002DD9DF16|nr:hypothetical protein [Micromonospora sp. NBC_01796]WSA87961.1 hypothetical protein OIE47_10320 [Micromonospora sp. NBC_01796]
MNISEVKATLREGIHATKQGQETFEQAASSATDATARALQLLHDSRNEDVEKVRQLLDEAKDEVNPTISRFSAAADSADDYLTSLG